MPEIYTKDWYDNLKELLNANPDLAKSAPGGIFNLLGTLRGDGRSPYIRKGEERSFVVKFDGGFCTEYYQVDEPPPRKSLNFIIVIPATVFEGIAAGIVDPVTAGLKGKFKIRGDMRVFIKHSKFVKVLHAVYTRDVKTIWTQGKPPYD